jgi:hypothetical protein
MPMNSPQDPDAREVDKLELLVTPDDAERADEFLEHCGPASLWHVQIRTAEVIGSVRNRRPLGTLDERSCTCVTLRLDRPVPVEPGLRIHLVAVDKPTLSAVAVVRPWGG